MGQLIGWWGRGSLELASAWLAGWPGGGCGVSAVRGSWATGPLLLAAWALLGWCCGQQGSRACGQASTHHRVLSPRQRQHCATVSHRHTPTPTSTSTCCCRSLGCPSQCVCVYLSCSRAYGSQPAQPAPQHAVGRCRCTACCRRRRCLVPPAPPQCGFDLSEPTAHNQGKPEAIARIREKNPYNTIVMIGAAGPGRHAREQSCCCLPQRALMACLPCTPHSMPPVGWGGASFAWRACLHALTTRFYAKRGWHPFVSCFHSCLLLC